MLEKLGKCLLVAFNSSFQQEDEPYQPFTSDQEVMCSIPAQRDSKGLLTMWGVGKGNENGSCQWRKSLWEVCGFWNIVYLTKFAMRSVIVMQCHVLLVPGPRLLVSLLMWIRHIQRQGQKRSGGQEQERQSNKWIWSGRQKFQGSWRI